MSWTSGNHRRLPVGPTCSHRGACTSACGPRSVTVSRWCSKAGPGIAPGPRRVVVALEPEGAGYFSGLVADAAAGTLYRYRLDGEAALCADPADSETFTRSKLDLSERQYHVGMYALHRDLLRLRREEPVFWAQRHGGLDGAVLGPEALVLRFFGTAGDDRLLVVNLGRDLSLRPAPEPLLAPPKGMAWGIRWSSEDPRYDGGGTAPLEGEDGWQHPGPCRGGVAACAP